MSEETSKERFHGALRTLQAEPLPIRCDGDPYVISRDSLRSLGIVPPVTRAAITRALEDTDLKLPFERAREGLITHDEFIRLGEANKLAIIVHYLSSLGISLDVVELRIEIPQGSLRHLVDCIEYVRGIRACMGRMGPLRECVKEGIMSMINDCID